MTGTHITDEHRRAFEALTSGDYRNFALISFPIDGAPGAAIVAVNSCPPTEDGGEPEVTVSPIFVYGEHDTHRPRRPQGMSRVSAVPHPVPPECRAPIERGALIVLDRCAGNGNGAGGRRGRPGGSGPDRRGACSSLRARRPVRHPST